MALGDGIRRNIAGVSNTERNRLRDAILALHTRFFPGSPTDFPAGGVSHWFKQDEIHQATHVHGGPAFVPWHRELCNRFEALLREVDPDLSLHYWDWNTEPSALFTSTFMGSASGDAGEPWLAGGFYDPTPSGEAYRDETPHALNKPTPDPSTWSYAEHSNPADPPRALTRSVSGGAPPIGTPGWPSDADIVSASSFEDMRTQLEQTHDQIHGFIGGTIGNPHTSFRDPFVFLLHSNVDRLFAMWQTQPGHGERLDPNQVYDAEGADPAITNPLEPWAGSADWPVRPWFTPENEQVVKNCKHPTVVRPSCYDTLPTFPATVTREALGPLTFNDVPENETAARAIVFSGMSCDDVHLEITSGPTVLTGPPGTTFGTFPPPLGTAATIPTVSSNEPPRGRIWISYRGTNAGDTATGTITVHCTETGEDFVVPITANTIARPTVAVMLTLDQSGSMDELAGVDATTKRIDVLHQAATQFVQLIQDSSRVGDAVGMVSFDHVAHPGVAVTPNLGSGFDLAPVTTAINAIQPEGGTSIGAGLELARATLNPVTGYDHKALVVFTDGLENTDPRIADVSGTIDDRTFAIGLGTAQQVSVGALTALANGTGGKMWLSGHLSPAIDDVFRLSKFFLEVLAGVTNNSIVTDPSGYLPPGIEVRIPFVLNETDIEATVILLSDLPVRFLIETPEGNVMDPAAAGALGATYAVGTGMSFYRFALPLPLGGTPAQTGRWHALLSVDDRIRGRASVNSAILGKQSFPTHGVRYSLTTQAYSNLRMDANLLQTSMAPGATVNLRAMLTEYGIPLAGQAYVRAELERPDGSTAMIGFAKTEPGLFRASTVAELHGVHRVRVLASGYTMRGRPFTREQLLTAAAVPGGDSPPPTGGSSNDHHVKELCRLFECLLQPDAFGRVLADHKIDPAVVRRCIERWCKARLSGPSDEELRRREGTGAARLGDASAGVAGGSLTSTVVSVLTDILRSGSASAALGLSGPTPGSFAPAIDGEKRD